MSPKRGSRQTSVYHVEIGRKSAALPERAGNSKLIVISIVTILVTVIVVIIIEIDIDIVIL